MNRRTAANNQGFVVYEVQAMKPMRDLKYRSFKRKHKMKEGQKDFIIPPGDAIEKKVFLSFQKNINEQHKII